MAARYCIACGNALAEGGAFCSNCGRPVHETAQVGTPQANVQVPPIPHPQQAETYYPPQAGSSVGQRGKVRTVYYWIAFVVLSVLVLTNGADGSAVAFIGLSIAPIWVFQDAKSRGMNPTNWAVGVGLLFIVFFPLYFFKRRPHVN